MIETERLLLRVPEDTDIDAWAAMLTDPEVTRFLGPRIDSREAVAAHIRTIRQRHEADGFGLLAIQRKQDNRMIGRSGFLVWDKRNWTSTTLRDAGKRAEVEVGWTLMREYWDFGYATEAGVTCRDYGFIRLGLRRIAAVIEHGNQRSIAVARRLGMTYEHDVCNSTGLQAELWVVTPSDVTASRSGL